MNKRELIIQDIVNTLASVETPRLGLVTRDPFNYEQLSRQQYPAIWVSAADEERSDMTMGGSSGRRRSVMEIVVVAIVKGAKDIDSLRNEIIDTIESALLADTKRNGYATNTQLRNIQVDFDIIEPYGRTDLTIVVDYNYSRDGEE